MAEQLLFCADNFFDPRQYPDHAVTADSEPSGTEAFHVGNGRRGAEDRWEPVTANATHYVTVVCGVLRGADFCAIDRESNLVSNARAGGAASVSLIATDDAFVSSATIINTSLPTVPGGALSGAGGALTDEDAWLKTFTPDAHDSWRLVIGAMGAGVVPQISGLWLGKAWQPTVTLLRNPLDDETIAIGGAVSQAPSGWEGSAKPSLVREGTLHIRGIGDDDYDMIRWQVMGLYASGAPAWICTRKSEQPWRAMLAQCPKGLMAWLRDDLSWMHSRTLDIPYRECQAAW
jgi:hypothetical protein